MTTGDICSKCGRFFINCICFSSSPFDQYDFFKISEEPAPPHVIVKNILIEEKKMNKSIKDLQCQLPWTTHYHHDFRSSPIAHKDFGHALLHVHKAAGKLAAVVDDAEHGGSEFKPEEVDKYIADLVICALRMANVCPGRIIDLEAAIIERIESKNNVKIK